MFACLMLLQGHFPASEPGVSTVLQGGVLGWRRYTTALKDGAITGGVAAGKAPQGAWGQPAIRAGNHENLTHPPDLRTAANRLRVPIHHNVRQSRPLYRRCPIQHDCFRDTCCRQDSHRSRRSAFVSGLFTIDYPPPYRYNYLCRLRKTGVRRFRRAWW